MFFRIYSRSTRLIFLSIAFGGVLSGDPLPERPE